MTLFKEKSDLNKKIGYIKEKNLIRLMIPEDIETVINLLVVFVFLAVFIKMAQPPK